MHKNKLLKFIAPEALIQEFESHFSITKISKKYNVNTNTVYSAFKIIGFDCRVRKDVSRILDKEELKNAYQELGTLKAVSKLFNITSDSVAHYMDKFEIPYKKFIPYKCNHFFFSQDTEESFYWAGFIAADGCIKINKGKNAQPTLSISLSSKDKDHLETLKLSLQAENPITEHLSKAYKPEWNDVWLSNLNIISQQLVDDLKRFNIVPRKTMIYTLPDWIKTHKLLHHFIRGYNDGDGSIYTPKLKDGRTVKQLYFSLRGTTEFLTDIRSILERECQLKIRNKPIRISSGHGCLEYGGNGVVKKITDYLYSDATIYLERKYID